MTVLQNLLLVSLLYLRPIRNTPLRPADEFVGKTVGDWMNSMEISGLSAEMNCGAQFSAGDWRNIIGTIKKDEILMNLRIAEVHEDRAEGGGGGVSAVYLSPEKGEAVLAFKGTQSPAEWRDNFLGGNAADTPQQKNALDWYRKVYRKWNLSGYEVTVSGHSKGGNKAKYIAVLEDTAAHGISFNGQGFSDRFFTKYPAQTMESFVRIENHNIDRDIVSLLLEDVGRTRYYAGQSACEEPEPFAQHGLKAFLRCGENGCGMAPSAGGTAFGLRALDGLMTAYLRSLSDEERNRVLRMLSELVQAAPDGLSFAEIMDLLKTGLLRGEDLRVWMQEQLPQTAKMFL